MPLKDHLNKLEYFCVIAETGSIRKASEIVRIGQPRLSKVIQELEDVLGVNLVVRSARGVNLTKEGRQLFENGRQIIEKANELELTIRSGDLSPSGEIFIGAYDSIARYFISGFIKYLSVAAPKVEINILTGRSALLMDKVANSEVDLAVLVATKAQDERIELKTLYSDQFSLFSAPAMGESFRNTLIYLPLVINDTEVSMRKFKFRQSIVCEGFETVRALAEQGVGVALLPNIVAKESLLAKRLVPFYHPRIGQLRFDSHDVVLCRNKALKNRTVEFIADELEAYFNVWNW
jgi:DNA-binding transcriptional LysR family regulator